MNSGVLYLPLHNSDFLRREAVELAGKPVYFRFQSGNTGGVTILIL